MKAIVIGAKTRFFVGLVLSMLLAPHLVAHAQEEWLPPQAIPLYGTDRPPKMLADQNGDVHAFYIQSIDDLGNDAIFYRMWSMERGWTQPIDILLSPHPGGISAVNPILDESGMIHLAFFGGQVGIEGGIYYTVAPASRANEPRSWSEIILLADDAGPIASLSLARDSTGNMSVVYAGKGKGVGIYEVGSTDNGITWSKPTIISLIYNPEHNPAQVYSYFDSNNKLHAVWTHGGASGLGEQVLYAGKDPETGLWDGGELLSEKQEFDFGTDYGTIIEHEGELIALFMDGPPAPAQHMRRSTDGGRTWSPPERLFPQEGGNGRAVMLHDSNGDLHIILANRVDELGIGGMWHGTWTGDGWSELELINAQSSYPEMIDAHSPVAVIVQGNILLTSWWHNIGRYMPASYSYTTLDAPELPAVSLMQQLETTSDNNVIPSNDEPAAPVVQLKPSENVQIDAQSGPSEGTNSGLTVVLGSIPVLLILVVFIFINRIRLTLRREA